MNDLRYAFGHIDPETGQVIRQERVPGLEGAIFASPVAADGKMYLVNAAGKIAVIAAGRALKLNDLRESCSNE